MLEIFRELEKSGDELIVTDNQRPVLQIRPIREKPGVEKIFSDVRGKVRYVEDILTPTTDEWEEC